MGAAGLVMAELKYPNMFDGLILYEPILFPPTPPEVNANTSPTSLAANALKRRYQWENYESAKQALENRGIFPAMDTRAFLGYIYGGMFENKGHKRSWDTAHWKDEWQYRQDWNDSWSSHGWTSSENRWANDRHGQSMRDRQWRNDNRY